MWSIVQGLYFAVAIMSSPVTMTGTPFELLKQRIIYDLTLGQSK